MYLIFFSSSNTLNNDFSEVILFPYNICNERNVNWWIMRIWIEWKKKKSKVENEINYGTLVCYWVENMRFDGLVESMRVTTNNKKWEEKEFSQIIYATFFVFIFQQNFTK